VANEIDIVIRGRDQASEGFDAARDAADRMARQVRAASTNVETAQLRVERSTQRLADAQRRFGEDSLQAREAQNRLTRAQNGLETASDRLARAERGVADGARSQAREVRAAGDAAEGSEKKTSKFSGALLAIGGVAATAALAAGTLLIGGIGKAFEQNDIRSKLAVQLGLAGQDAADIGRTAGAIYADNFGTDLGQVSDAVREVYRNIGKMADGPLQDVTAKVLTLTDVFEQDLGGTTAAVGQMMKTGMAKDATEALDIITAGLQQGADKAGDLMDTFNEYGTQFRKVGLDGKTAMGLLAQGLKAGARDADLVADSIKEFAIRAIDGSKTTADGFKAIGLDAKKMAADIAAGGPRANAALDLTLDRLRSIKDPVKQSAAAVQLFGTQAEDMGKALFALDPSTAVTGLGNVAGAAQRASDAMGDTPSARIEKFKRTITQGFVNGLGNLIGKLGDASDKSSTLGKAWDKLSDAVKTIIDYGKSYYGTIMKIVDLAMPLLKTALDNGKKAFDDLKNSGVPWKQLLETLAVVLGVVAGVIVVAVIGALAALSFQLRMAATLVKPLWEAFKTGTRLILGFLGMVIDGAAAAFGWIPGIGPKLKDAAKKFHEFADNVNAALNDIKDRQVKITATATVNGQRITTYSSGNVRVSSSGGGRTSVNQMKATGGIVGAAATGGLRNGLTLVGEQGAELLDLAPGTRVHSNPDTERMLAAGVGGRGVALQLEWVGGNAGDEFMTWLRKNIRVRGGVTAALGGA
jgi:phage-related minor tail protein